MRYPAPAPDRRAYELDSYDAFCARQIARIQQYLHDPAGRRARERDERHAEQPDHCEQRGHASGARKPSLAEIEGDE